MLPIARRRGQVNQDHVLLAWPSGVELWQLGPIAKKGFRKIDGVRTVIGFEYVDGNQYWLVGTTSAQLHLLSAWDIPKGTRDTPELKCLATVDVLPSTQPRLAISAVSTRAVPNCDPPSARKESPQERNQAVQLLPQALLFVGFEDGSVRTYVLQDLFWEKASLA